MSNSFANNMLGLRPYQRKVLRNLSAEFRLSQAGSPWEMGPFLPVEPAKRMVYVGCSRKLLGRAALVSFDPAAKKAYAQFNDHETGKSYGWWPFSMHVWEDME